MKKNTIKFYLDDEQSARLKAEAARRNLSVSALVNEHLDSVINHATVAEPAILTKQPIVEGRTECLNVLLSPAEMKEITKAAKQRQWSISKLVREHLFKNSTPIELAVKTDDIAELVSVVDDIYIHLIGTTDALRMRNQISDADTDKLKGLAEDILSALKNCANQSFDNRNIIRKKEIQRLNKIIEKELKQLKEEK